tara:strand:- start:80 stop:661 length:582 start_codon:yes stop_codon:yes gene_type:complete
MPNVGKLSQPKPKKKKKSLRKRASERLARTKIGGKIVSRSINKQLKKDFKGKNVGIGVSGQANKKKKKPSLSSRVKTKIQEVSTSAGRSKARRRKIEKKFTGIRKAGGEVGWVKKKGDKKFMSPTKKKMLGSKKGTKIRKGAVGATVTEGGVYAKYKKDSRAAGSFQKKFKKECSNGAKSFKWDGRLYSCKKK